MLLKAVKTVGTSLTRRKERKKKERKKEREMTGLNASSESFPSSVNVEFTQKSGSLHYNRAFDCISFRRLLLGDSTSLLTEPIASIEAFIYSSWPALSANAKTRVLTVAPSRRFFLQLR